MTGDRRLALALRAFPRRYRSARAAEIRAVFADAEAAGEARVYGVRALLDVVRAGFVERLRTRPPLLRYLRYKLGGRLPDTWHPWMMDDVNGRLVGLRDLPLWTFPIVNVLMTRLLTGALPAMSTVVSMAVVVGAVGLAMRGIIRRRILRANGYDHRTCLPLELAPPAPVRLVARPVRRWPASTTCLAWGAALVLVAPFAIAAFVAPPASSVRTAFGSLRLFRSVEHQRVVGLVLCGAAIVVLVVSLGAVRRIEATMFRETAPQDAGAVGPGAALWLPVLLYGVVGVAIATAPLSPLAGPALSVVAGGLGPTVLLLGLRARRRERATGCRVVLTRRSAAVHAPTSR